VEEGPGRGWRKPATDISTRLLWVPFSLFAGMLAWISAENVPCPTDDIWIVLARVREFFELGGLGAGGDSFSRLVLNGWLSEQTMLSLVLQPQLAIEGSSSTTVVTAFGPHLVTSSPARPV